MLRHVFFHNPHDRASTEKLAALQSASVKIDEIVAATTASIPYPVYRLRTMPAYVVFDIYPQGTYVVFSAEEDNIDPSLLASMVFQAHEPELTPEQQKIVDLEVALAAKDQQLAKAEIALAYLDERLRKLENPA
jgi:hypothetical protein